MRATLIALSLVSAPAFGQDCPASPDTTRALADLFNAARAARTETEGREIGRRMWEVWATAPDDRAQEMLDRGMRAGSSADYAAAVAAFDELVAYCPDYAEGYNQRAFIAFLRHDYGAALVDLERTLALSPDHVPAMAGMSLTLMGLGRHKAAQGVLRDALKLNPWLSERHLLREPPGEEL